ncbi:glycosyltransferase family protein [Paraburkholderia tropica]|uniref:NTP transferase domain-containing protein n=1 Tax=Paraburkholderia tropica TaxID=92647 RepID=UPI002AB6B45F|nr:NTP transferase domain-containing protein [Paraburkholderia tropica]
MSILIIPAAGRSSRFPGTRPKWLLTMPDGKLMVEKAIEGCLAKNQFDRAILVCLQEHLEKYCPLEKLEQILTSISGVDIHIFVLEDPTQSQAETVALTLKKFDIDSPFLIKDCDNYFEFEWNKGNQVAVVDAHKAPGIELANKSYVVSDALNVIQNIVEKQIVSHLFCCGAYGFGSPRKFIDTFEAIDSLREVYVSHIIYSLLMEGDMFEAKEAFEYVDWGTFDAYRKFARSSLTVFCDLDGVLMVNGSKFGKLGWKTDTIESNVAALRALMQKFNVHLVITTSRPESESDYVKAKLAEAGIVPQSMLMGLPHTKRVLINDFCATNPYPTAISINLERNSPNLQGLMDGLVI